MVVKKVVKKVVKAAPAKKVVKKTVPAAKKTVSKTKTVRKTRTPRAVVEIKPINKVFKKTEIMEGLARRAEIEPKQVKKVFAELEKLMLGSVHPKGVGEFTLPGLFKIVTKKVPARKAGTMVRNPATGLLVKGKAKPASVRVRIRALTKVRKAALPQ